ncbi:hypothetical protein QKW35_19895 [Pontibacterium granulatum]|uniref:hypothetical protein n=1 Tax=Pontibacterium granulatum TaxID=2036029 RepID=UPI00249B3F88|nr:hypothetical protein [Pontibacterium granulatum]MDI3326644.1 hypothetical protein [Pontibacterium granulatum]
MKLNEVTALALRILGIYLAIRALRTFTMYTVRYDQVTESNFGDTANLVYAEGVIFFLCAALLLKFPASIANKIVPRSSTNSPIINTSGQSLEISAFVIIGVFTLSWSVPDLIDNAIYMYELKQFVHGDNRAWTDAVGRQFVTLIEIAIGLYLALGSRGLHKVINKLRQ